MRILIALLLLTLTACTSWQVRASDTCISYGFHPGTESYAHCMERAHEKEQAAWAAFAQGMQQMNQQQQQQQQQDLQRQQLYQQRQPVNCTTTRYGNTASTQCY